MKNFKLIRKPMSFILPIILLGAVSFSSCSKNDDEANSELSASVRIVNTVEGSSKQDLYLDGTKVNASATAYGEASEYAKVKSGERKGEFRSSGSSTVNTSMNLNLDAGNYYSVYYAADASSSTSLLVKDDMTAPAANKARVRFVHLSKAAANAVDLAISSGVKIFTDLAFKQASAYKDVDANTKFMLYSSGSATVGLNIPTTVKAGKIYTIVVSGSTLATIKYHVLVQN